MIRPEFTNDDDAFHAFNDLMTTTDDDKEIQHSMADQFVRDLLKQQGYPKLAAAFLRAQIGWWYA